MIYYLIIIEINTNAYKYKYYFKFDILIALKYIKLIFIFQKYYNLRFSKYNL